MYRCSTKCCENSSYSLEEVQHCIDQCSNRVNKAQNYIQNELQVYQVCVICAFLSYLFVSNKHLIKGYMWVLFTITYNYPMNQKIVSPFNGCKGKQKWQGRVQSSAPNTFTVFNKLSNCSLTFLITSPNKPKTMALKLSALSLWLQSLPIKDCAKKETIQHALFWWMMIH